MKTFKTLAPPPVRAAVRRVLSSAAKITMAFMTLVEAPLFLIRRRDLFNNKLICVCRVPSFGHTISGLDYASRVYFPFRISLVFIPHPRTNEVLPACFSHNIDAFIYKSLIPSQEGTEDEVRFYILRFFLLLISGLFGSFEVIGLSNVYKILSLSEGRLFNLKKGPGNVIQGDDLTGYCRLLREGIGQKPRLPETLLNRCRREIMRTSPEFFQKPFVTMGLREKGRGKALDSAIRCSGPQENYRKAVEYLVECGNNVVGTCETDHGVFHDIRGYYNPDRWEVPAPLLNIFLLTHCRLFIGQLSGPYQLPNSCGIPVLLSDSMPYRYGTFRSTDLVLFKHLRNRTTRKDLSLVEIYRDHPELAMGLDYASRGIDIEPNSSEEILEAVKETLSVMNGDLQLSDEDRVLIDKCKKMYSPEMYIYYEGNRPALSTLRHNRDALMRL